MPSCSALGAANLLFFANFTTWPVNALLAKRGGTNFRVGKGRMNFGCYLSGGIIGSAEALPILCVRYFRWEREIQTDREIERDGSDVTITVALKLAMNLHFPLPKIRTIGDELTLSLAKNSHFSFLPSHFPSLPFAERSPWWRWNSQWVHTFHCQKFFRPQALFPLFQMARAARRVIENPRQKIKSCPVLFFFPSKNWIKLIPKTIGNRKRDCAWGGSGW